jgi:phage gp46-like protein
MRRAILLAVALSCIVLGAEDAAPQATKPTAQHSMARGITNQHHRIRNAQLELTVSYWAARPA